MVSSPDPFCSVFCSVYWDGAIGCYSLFLWFTKVNSNTTFEKDMDCFSEPFLDWVHISMSGPSSPEDGVYYEA